MRLPCCLAPVTLALTLVPSPASAQAGRTTPWRFGAMVESVHFSRALIDGNAPSSEAAGLRPSGGVGLGVALARVGSAWRIEATAGWSGVHPQADNAGLALTDKTVRLTRWQLGSGAERRLCEVGAAVLGLGAGPVIEWWRVSGEGRVRFGGRAAVVLRLPLGGWELENRLGAGVSASPFVPGDAGSAFKTRALTSLFLGLAVRAPL